MSDIILRLYNNAVNYFASAEWEHLRFILKTVSTALVVIFGVLFFMILKWTNALYKKMEIPAEEASGSIKEKPADTLIQWQKIMNYLESENGSDWKIAIIEADQFLDNILEKANFPGKTLSERLSNMNPTEMPALNDLFYAHRIRNNIVHDNNFKITKDDAERVLKIYKKALADLEAI